ncbi:Nucleoside-diphosphate-sugar epimerase [Flexibacter flexilis DSM 6793]|uniref:Nucleoside-diphosphate-sugar epimerase n=1 Tax=Flexibacter flexilis DSM 6793 TaxID=927664 RepID=A0A1I1NK78_9BACT|nr:NAD-dependent epimerase/dehydratase family protein [Flexibacter flexilis]SFC98084.1 Nucleoside-diphosphate-sugar epimerase [Flexibacter flexilis DSM 6793]
MNETASLTILLTGGAGFLGKHITAFHESIGNKVVTLGRERNNTLVTDLSNTVPDLSNYTFDYVIHAAGKAHVVPQNQAEEQEFFDVNYWGTINLLAGLEKCPTLPKGVVLISTVAVYGLDSGELIKESQPLAASEPYGKSKIQAEEAVKDWGVKHGVSAAALRLPLVAGTNPPGNLGAMISGISKGFYLSIGEADARKSIVLANDVAKIAVKAAQVGGIYNLSDGHHPNFEELETLISQQLGKKKPIKIPYFVAKMLAWAGDAFFFVTRRRFPINSRALSKITSPLTFDDTLARQQLGWKPTGVLQGFKIK